MTGREWARRGLHIALGSGAFLLPTLGYEVVALLCGSAILFNWLVLPRWASTRWLLRDGDQSGHRGLVIYPAVVLGLVLVARNHFALAQSGWIALAVGDGLAPIIGSVLTVPRWPWCKNKSVLGSAGALAAAGLVLGCLMPWPSALGAAVGGMIGDSAPSPLDDNYTVPFGAALGFLVASGSLA